MNKRAEPAVTTGKEDLAHEVIQATRILAAELKTVSGEIHVSLDSSFQRELGIDSLGMAELLVRLERRFHVHLPETLLGEAESPRDLLRAIETLGEKTARTIATQPKLSPLEAATDTPHNVNCLTDVLDWHSDRHPDRPHILLSDGFVETDTITYGALRDRAQKVARGPKWKHLKRLST